MLICGRIPQNRLTRSALRWITLSSPLAERGDERNKDFWSKDKGNKKSLFLDPHPLSSEAEERVGDPPAGGDAGVSRLCDK